MEADIAYLAGFFDGEGHIRITKHSTRGSYMLQVSCVQATRYPLDLFLTMYGGTLAKRFANYKGMKKALYTWQASSAKAEKFLKDVRPYLRCKGDEADLALSFRETFGPMHVKGGQKKLSLEVLEKRKGMMFELQQIRKDKREAA